MEKLKWCFKIKDGIKVNDPSNEISASYFNLSITTLQNAELMLNKDLLWTTVMIYYAEYYALYSFLTKIGIKCENHTCSILLVKYLLKEEIINIIEEHKKKRIDAQYYLKVGMKKEVKNMLKDAKFFISWFDNFISNLSERDIIEFNRKVHKIKINSQFK